MRPSGCSLQHLEFQSAKSWNWFAVENSRVYGVREGNNREFIAPGRKSTTRSLDWSALPTGRRERACEQHDRAAAKRGTQDGTREVRSRSGTNAIYVDSLGRTIESPASGNFG